MEQLLARCYIGDSLYAEKQVASGGETIFWDLDVSILPRGLHQIRTQVHGLEEQTVSVATNYLTNTPINNVVFRTSDEGWYTLQGVRLTEQPRVKGLYIHRGKVVVVE